MQTGQARAGRRAGVAAAAIWMTACLLPPGVQAAGAAGAAPSEDAGAQSSAPQDDNVVDAEFTEVKDDEK